MQTASGRTSPRWAGAAAVPCDAEGHNNRRTSCIHSGKRPAQFLRRLDQPIDTAAPMPVAGTAALPGAMTTVTPAASEQSRSIMLAVRVSAMEGQGDVLVHAFNNVTAADGFEALAQTEARAAASLKSIRGK